MGHRFAEHTGEVEIVAEAATKEAVFGEVLEAFAELVGRGSRGRRAVRDVFVRAPDDGSLLVEWVNELVFLAESEGFVPERAASLELAGGRLAASVEGRVEAGPANLVKAATFSGLQLERRDGAWHARIVLDV
jgi:SHS2 domain-containing protein